MPSRSSALFEPITLRGLTIPNRVWMSPMCQYSAADSGPLTGVPTDWHLVHLGSRAVGGTGLVMAEATAVSPQGRISRQDTGLWNVAQQEGFARITRFVTEQGVVAGVQLAHAGRKGSVQPPADGGGPLGVEQGGWTAVGPSPVAFDGYPVPHELGIAEIDAIVADFAAAAERAHAAGFQVVEVHGAHGYLLHAFASPHSNRRADSYGGSFDNRIRLPLAVAEAVRAVWPADLPVFYRVSATDWLPDDAGWTGADTVRLAKELGSRGIDLIDVSSGGNAGGVTIPVGPGYQVRYATEVRQLAGLPAAAVGLITEAHQAEEIVATGQADAILLGRELLRRPYWPREAASDLDADPPWPRQYLRARR